MKKVQGVNDMQGSMSAEENVQDSSLFSNNITTTTGRCRGTSKIQFQKATCSSKIQIVGDNDTTSGRDQHTKTQHFVYSRDGGEDRSVS